MFPAIYDCNMVERLRGKSIMDMYPELCKEWDYVKNNKILPEMVTKGSNIKFWWKCSNGHEWQTNVATRVKGIGCPYCSGRYVIQGKTDLITTNPELVKEWNYDKNYPLTPQMVSKSTSKKVWWKCQKGHEWQAIVASRTNGIGCPYCSGRYVIQGKTDLITTNSELVKEWNCEKNYPLTPQMVSKSSNKKVWWKCSKGHEWQASPNYRTRGCGCPYCVSKKILQGYNDLATTRPDLAKEWNYEKNYNLTPQMVSKGSQKKVWWKCEKGHEWQAVISSRNDGRGCPYCSNHKVLQGYNDLATNRPDLVKEWNYKKNGTLMPQMVATNSDKNVWWKGKCGHEWHTAIYNRTMGKGCPYCRGRKKIENATERENK